MIYAAKNTPAPAYCAQKIWEENFVRNIAVVVVNVAAMEIKLVEFLQKHYNGCKIILLMMIRKSNYCIWVCI